VPIEFLARYCIGELVVVYSLWYNIRDRSFLLSGFDSHFFVVGEIIWLEVLASDEE
jgi:hypothetical protein